MVRAGLYARVSTEDQNVVQQMEYLKSYAAKQGYMVVRRVMDTESGRTPLTQRKKFLKLLDESKTGSMDLVLVVNLDRLTRNWEDVVLIEKHFRELWAVCKLVSAGDSVDLGNASGRLMFRIKMALCCFMPEDMREKQEIGIERAKKEGKYLGRKPGSRNLG